MYNRLYPLQNLRWISVLAKYFTKGNWNSFKFRWGIVGPMLCGKVIFYTYLILYLLLIYDFNACLSETGLLIPLPSLLILYLAFTVASGDRQWSDWELWHAFAGDQLEKEFSDYTLCHRLPFPPNDDSLFLARLPRSSSSMSILSNSCTGKLALFRGPSVTCSSIGLISIDSSATKLGNGLISIQHQL